MRRAEERTLPSMRLRLSFFSADAFFAVASARFFAASLARNSALSAWCAASSASPSPASAWLATAVAMKWSCQSKNSASLRGMKSDLAMVVSPLDD
jgi:hypothetical protein